MVSLGPELTNEQVLQSKNELAKALAAWREGVLSVDCEGITEFDGAGIQLLTLLAMELRDRGGSLQLTGCRPALRHRLSAVALNHWFEFDAAEAL